MTGTPNMPAFPAQWFTAYSALSPVSGRFSHRRFPRNVPARNLIPASGDRDHALLPSAPACFVAAHQRVHRSPHPTLVTIRSVPLDEARDDASIHLICVSEKAKHFSQEGLTRIRDRDPSGKSVSVFCLDFQGVGRENHPTATRIKVPVRSEISSSLEGSGIGSPSSTMPST